MKRENETQRIDINEIKDVLGAAKQASADPSEIVAYDVLKAATILSKFRSLLKPAETLPPIPAGMRVFRYVPDKKLVVSLAVSDAEKGHLATFSFVHWLTFPGLLGAFIATVVGRIFSVDDSEITGGTIGAFIGFLLWLRLSLRGPYISIDLKKRKYAIYSVAYARWSKGPPSILIQSVRGDGGWIANLVLAGYQVATSAPAESHDEAEKAYRHFVNALNWKLGNQVAIAEGVFIDPLEASGRAQLPSGKEVLPRDEESAALHAPTPGTRVRLSGSTFEELFDAILSGFTRPDLVELVRFDLNERLDAIVSMYHADRMAVLKLIEWAMDQDRIEQLIRSIQKRRPDNSEIQRVASDLLPAS